MNNLYLVYIKPFTKNNDGTFEYDFLFSEIPDVVWGFDWEVLNPASCTDLTPDPTTFSKSVRVRIPLPLKTIEETTCYSMEYAIAKIIALGWVDIENLEEYPEKRLVFHFGETFEEV